jgi:hypothetical protein
LLEAATQAVCEHRPVLYVVFDIESKGALATMASSRGLFGAALVLAPVAQRQQHRKMILTSETVNSLDPTPARSVAAPLVADNAMAPCMPLFEVLAYSSPRTVSLCLSRLTALNVQVN